MLPIRHVKFTNFDSHILVKGVKTKHCMQTISASLSHYACQMKINELKHLYRLRFNEIQTMQTLSPFQFDFVQSAMDRFDIDGFHEIFK